MLNEVVILIHKDFTLIDGFLAWDLTTIVFTGYSRIESWPSSGWACSISFARNKNISFRYEYVYISVIGNSTTASCTCYTCQSFITTFATLSYWFFLFESTPFCLTCLLTLSCRFYAARAQQEWRNTSANCIFEQVSTHCKQSIPYIIFYLIHLLFVLWTFEAFSYAPSACYL